MGSARAFARPISRMQESKHRRSTTPPMQHTEIDYEHGITAIDSGYGRAMLDAIHLIVECGRAAVVDTGTNDSVPRVLASLRAHGIEPAQVDWVLLTHVHLDHAGGAGRLLSQLPEARLAVHPRGARHMADPARLMQGTIEVYGEAQARAMYGEIVPVPAERIVEVGDGSEIALADRVIRVLDTPGHARHHVCYLDTRTGHAFTGDTFGLSYRELDDCGRNFVFPSTTPVQFDPPALHRSIDRLLALSPDALYLTHFGQVRDIPRLGADLHRLVDAHAALAERWRGAAREERAAGLRDGVRSLVLDEARRQGWALPQERVLELFSGDIVLNAAGLEAWLDASSG
jgi:hydroxyacylglutathione hydrolase